MDINKIKENLQARFDAVLDYPKKRHIIFWYDEGGSFKEIVQQLKLEVKEKDEIKRVKNIYIEKGLNRKGEEISTNIFEIKYQLEVEDKSSHYLIYSEYGRPDDRENFLLDIELYAESFEANKTAMIVEEFNFDRLDNNINEIVKKYERFFGSKERKEKLKRLLENLESQRIKVEELELGILATLSNSKTLNVEDIISNIVMDETKLNQIEKWMDLEELYKVIALKYGVKVNSFDSFLKILLTVHFYKSIGISKIHTNLENYFVGNKPELYLLAENLLQNKNTSNYIKKYFYSLGKDLSFGDRIKELELEELVLGISFEYFDILVLKEIVERIMGKVKDYKTYMEYINIRLDNTLWKEKFNPMYKALLNSINFLELMENLEIRSRESAREVIKDYTTIYYKVDRFYRDFYYYLDKSQDLEVSELLDGISKRISIEYEEKYLNSLSDEWSKNYKKNSLVSKQRNFYDDNIKNSNSRVAVIISDALRYEIGQEIEEQLKREVNSREVDLKSMMTELPSITSLGMANLLPHNGKINFNIDTSKVSIDGIDTSTTINREFILKREVEESSAITYNKFRTMNRTEQDNYIKGQKVIYIYHDTIDAIGDKGKTERNTFRACNEAVEDIVSLTKTLSSIGVVNILITSDHGFLYERETIEEYNKLEFYNEYKILGKRYGLGESVVEEKGCLSMEFEDYCGVFPKRTQRIKVSGSGLQFVHGGMSIQEVLIPLIKFRSGSNATKSRKVGVRLKKDLGKITSNLTKFSLYQLEEVNINTKVLERHVKMAIYDFDGNKISDEVKLTIDGDKENLNHNFRLILNSGTNNKAILKVIDIESGDILDSREYIINLSITADFDF